MPAQQLRQLRDIGRDPAGLIFAEQLRRRIVARLAFMLNGCSETSGYRFSFLQCLGLYRLLQQSPATTVPPEKYCIAKQEPQLGEVVNCGRPLFSICAITAAGSGGRG